MKHLLLLATMLLFSAVVVFGQEKYKQGLAAMQKGQYQQAISYFNQQKRDPNVSAKTIKDCQTQIAECERQIKLKAQRAQEQRHEQEAIEAKQRRVVNVQGSLYVYFPNGKYDLSSEQKRDIKSYIESVEALHKDVSLEIIGCCNTAEGSASSHPRLAQQRTDAVLNVIRSCNGNYMIRETVLGGTDQYSVTDKSKNDVVVIMMLGQSKFSLGESAMNKGNYDQAITYFTEAKKAAKDAGTVSLCKKKIAECIRLKMRKEPNNRQNNSVQPKQSTQPRQSAPSSGYENGHEWVDLGLSVKWATVNLGADSPSDYGNYYAWGETSTKATYEWSSYKWCKGDYDNQTKYNTDSQYGSVDNRTRLSLTDDAARANWGGNWRMPTKEEFEELKTNCTWKWTTEWGVNGYKVTSKKNGNSIFLPAAGYRDGSTVYNAGSGGYYWSSSLISDYPPGAWGLYFGSSDFSTYDDYRLNGLSVRPVTE